MSRPSSRTRSQTRRAATPSPRRRSVADTNTATYGLLHPSPPTRGSSTTEPAFVSPYNVDGTPLRTGRASSISCPRPEPPRYDPQYYPLSQGMPNRTPPYEQATLEVTNRTPPPPPVRTPTNPTSSETGSSLSRRLSGSDLTPTPPRTAHIAGRRPSARDLNDVLESMEGIQRRTSINVQTFNPTIPRRADGYRGASRRDRQFLLDHRPVGGGSARLLSPRGAPSPFSPVRGGAARISPTRLRPTRAPVTRASPGSGRRPVLDSESQRAGARSGERGDRAVRRRGSSLANVIAGMVKKLWRDATGRRGRRSRSPTA